MGKGITGSGEWAPLEMGGGGRGPFVSHYLLYILPVDGQKESLLFLVDSLLTPFP